MINIFGHLFTYFMIFYLSNSHEFLKKCKNIDEATIVFVSDEPDFETGYVPSWILIRIKDRKDYASDIYVPYLKKSKFKFSIGDQCNIKVFSGTINGFVGKDFIDQQIIDSQIASQIECGEKLHR